MCRLHNLQPIDFAYIRVIQTGGPPRASRPTPRGSSGLAGGGVESVSEKQVKGPVKKLVLKKETVKSLKLQSGLKTGAAVPDSIFNFSNGGLSAGYGGPPKYTDASCAGIIASGGVILDP